jgi:hypothetical protein
MARQGYVVFTYDMVGQNDTDQIPHHWSEARHDSVEYRSHGNTALGQHQGHRLRIVASRRRSNTHRRTGASGGGTQTFFLMAVDDRIKAAAPVNMISATAQGGVCENAANLRAGWPDFSNMVVGALMAPRPLILISNGGDWTVETPKEVFPPSRAFTACTARKQRARTCTSRSSSTTTTRKAARRSISSSTSTCLNKPAPVTEKAFRVDFPQELLALQGGRGRRMRITGLDQLVDNMIRDDRSMTLRLQPRDAATLATARDAFAERLTFSLLALRPTRPTCCARKGLSCGG